MSESRRIEESEALRIQNEKSWYRRDLQCRLWLQAKLKRSGARIEIYDPYRPAKEQWENSLRIWCNLHFDSDCDILEDYGWFHSSPLGRHGIAHRVRRFLWDEGIDTTGHLLTWNEQSIFKHRHINRNGYKRQGLGTKSVLALQEWIGYLRFQFRDSSIITNSNLSHLSGELPKEIIFKILDHGLEDRLRVKANMIRYMKDEMSVPCRTAQANYPC